MPRVVEFRAQKSDPEHESWLKRQAIQIAAQLPEKEADALAILEYARGLVRDYLAVKPS